MTPRGPRPARLPLLALGLLALLGALWGGLVRLGWPAPASPALVAAHGPLMVSGFLGTVIALERAVAVGGRASLLVPLVTGLGGLALLLEAPAPAGQVLLVAGGVGLGLLFAVILRRQRALFTVTMALGAVAWLGGNALWLAGWPLHRVVPWWIGFLVLTIGGERLELARLVRVPPASRRAFALIVGGLLLALALGVARPGAGMRLAGLAMVALAGWLGMRDVARRTVRAPGLPRFTAVCLLSGYAWLGAAGLLALAVGAVPAGPAYDALLHAVFLGFVMAMAFGHAPIIFPAVLGRSMPFRRGFYAHLVLLHASLAVRVAGNLAGWVDGRRWGGLLNAVAIVLFLASTVLALARGSPLGGGPRRAGLGATPEPRTPPGAVREGAVPPRAGGTHGSTHPVRGLRASP